MRQRELSRKISTSSFQKALPKPPPNGGLKSSAAPKVISTRSKLYSEKYRDGVVKRIVSGITSITEVKESLELSESDVVDWIKQCFQRKEDRVEMLREALELYKKDIPDFNVERLMLSVKRSELAKARSIADKPPVEPQPVEGVDDPVRRTINFAASEHWQSGECVARHFFLIQRDELLADAPECFQSDL